VVQYPGLFCKRSLLSRIYVRAGPQADVDLAFFFSCSISILREKLVSSMRGEVKWRRCTTSMSLLEVDVVARKIYFNETYYVVEDG
jgi:hypothetical protein